MFKIDTQSRAPQATTMGLPKLKLGKGHNIMLIIMACSGIVIIMVAFFGAGFVMSLGYEGGWEVRTRFDSVYIASQTKWFTGMNTPMGAIKQPWNPTGVKFDPTPLTEYRWDYRGEPDIEIYVDGAIHTTEDDYHALIKNQDRTKVIQAPNEVFVREIHRVIDGTHYYYYHHVYAYMVTIETSADQTTEGHLFWNSDCETKGEEGVPLEFTVRTRFTVSPWQIIGELVPSANGTPDAYRVDYAWVGVMGASVDLVLRGYSERWLNELDAAEVGLYVTTGATMDPPNQYQDLGMWLMDGDPATNRYNPDSQSVTDIPEDPSTILGIPRDVFIDVSGELEAGAQQGAFMVAIPHDVFMQITIRVDILTAAGYVPVAGTDPLPEPPDPKKDAPVPFWYPLAYALGNLFGSYWWVIVMVIVIVFIVLILIVATRIKALVRK